MISGRNMQRKSLQRSEIEQGDIVLIDFSYSDLKRSKFRPALVISNSRYNSTSLDVIVLRITSKSKREWAIKKMKLAELFEPLVELLKREGY